MQISQDHTVTEMRERIGTRVRYADFTGSMTGRIVSVKITTDGVLYEIAWDNSVAGTTWCDLSKAGWTKVEPGTRGWQEV